MSEQQPDSESERLPDEFPGAPRYFSYPKPLPTTEEEKKRFAEVYEKMAKPKRRTRRRQRRAS
jgi:hypothetical protein